MRLQNKVAIITGASRGQGAAEARLFSKEGAKVVVADILESEGQKVVDDINDGGGEAIFIKLDISMEENWTRAINTTIAKFKKIDILINNAAIVILAMLEDTTLQMWDKQMSINARGAFLGTKAVVPAMRQAGGGSIVNVSSLGSHIALPGLSAYAASKGAMRIFTKSTAVEFATDGIRANSVHPGTIRTPMVEEYLKDPEYVRIRMQNCPLGRVAEPEEIAYGVLYLASDEASYVTGSELIIDGGRAAQ
ncbi:glucose 1-dehydrogenase [SAR202 cluster bacterium AD-804-J14_MRT_500m]|nr:glucose 1-dehydrogenase [SAR202 cluster bacterium AD-804-J14_MRT_500m]